MRISHKLGVAALLFLVPISFGVWLLISQQNKSIDFAEKEIVGLHYLRGLSDVHFALVQASMGGPLDVAAAANTVAELETRDGAGMESAAHAAKAIAAIRAADRGKDAALSAARAELRTLIARIGDKSNLILDPDLDSYYEMDIVLIKLPDILDRVVDLRDAAAKSFTDTTLDADEKLDLTVRVAGLQTILEGLDSSIQSGYDGSADGSVRKALLRVHDGHKARVGAVAPLWSSRAPTDKEAAEAIASLRDFYRITSNDLERLLVTRIKGFNNDQLVSLLVTGALFLMAIVAVLWVVLRLVIRPLRAMTAGMQRLAGGDLRVEVAMQDRRDELGDMARAMQVFHENAVKAQAWEAEQVRLRQVEQNRLEALESHISGFNDTIGSVIGSVSTAGAELHHTAEVMSTTAGQTQDQLNAVAAASEEASVNVQTVASASEQLSSSIQDIGRRVAQSAVVTEEAVAQASATNVQIKQLADAAKSIGDVVNLISDIASQTNLLALNATIEAARAGEAGKGFSVVASEVKSLANQTAKATEDISAKIAEIQMTTERSVQAIETIVGTVGRIKDIAASVAAEVEEQSAATSEITRNVRQASVGTREVSANIVGVSRTASNTSAASAQVLSAARELSKQSDLLRAQVAGFITQVRSAA